MTGPVPDPPGRPDGLPVRTVTIEAIALDTIRAEVISSSPHLETGGILLGHPAAAGTELRITIAGEPGPHAVHEPRRFSRDPVHAQAIADRAWAAHGAVWIGEWHTHPEAGLLPSDIDLGSYLTHLVDPDLGFEEFLSLIVAGTDTGPGVAAWIITTSHLIEAQLELAAHRDDEDDLGPARPAGPVGPASPARTRNWANDEATDQHDRETT